MESSNYIIKVLPERILKNGYIYNLITRTPNKAIYKQTLDNIQVGYEVFQIRVRGAHFSEILGKEFPAKERFPANEDFGKIAWCYVNYEDALKRFKEI